jgi:lauroyl/myristoyl acyltransferase
MSQAWIARQAMGHISGQLLRHLLVMAAAPLPGRWDAPLMRAAMGSQAIGWPLRQSRYAAALCHLQALGLDHADAIEQAALHVAIELLRDVRFRRYEIRRPAQWRRRIHDMQWNDPHHYWQEMAASGGLIALLHTGEYRLAVARVIEAHPQPAHVLVPALCREGDAMFQALKSLEAFGHRVDVVHPGEPGLATALFRHLRRGCTAVAFIDLPAAIGPQRFGDPVRCRFLGRDARLALAPLQLAAKAGCPVLLAASWISRHGTGHLELLHRAGSLTTPDAVQAVLQSASDFITHDPSNWFLLDRLDNYLHARPQPRSLA